MATISPHIDMSFICLCLWCGWCRKLGADSSLCLLNGKGSPENCGFAENQTAGEIHTKTIIHHHQDMHIECSGLHFGWAPSAVIHPLASVVRVVQNFVMTSMEEKPRFTSRWGLKNSRLQVKTHCQRTIPSCQKDMYFEVLASFWVGPLLV